MNGNLFSNKQKRQPIKQALLVLELMVLGWEKKKLKWPLLNRKCKQIIVNHFFSERDFWIGKYSAATVTKIIIFCLSLMKRETTGLLSRGFLLVLLHVYRHENSPIYFCLQPFFISSTIISLWQNQYGVLPSICHFSKERETGIFA